MCVEEMLVRWWSSSQMNEYWMNLYWINGYVSATMCTLCTKCINSCQGHKDGTAYRAYLNWNYVGLTQTFFGLWNQVQTWNYGKKKMWKTSTYFNRRCFKLFRSVSFSIRFQISQITVKFIKSDFIEDLTKDVSDAIWTTKP